jgi:hypothetical protein
MDSRGKNKEREKTKNEISVQYTLYEIWRDLLSFHDISVFHISEGFSADFLALDPIRKTF